MIHPQKALALALVAVAGIGLTAPLRAIDLPFTEDFELSDGGFTTSSSGGWKWGAPVSPEGPGAARSGTRVWGTNLEGSYAPNLNATLVSPSYDLSAAAGQHILVHWWQFLVTERGFDFGEVQVSKNGGGTWETVLGPRHGVVDPEWTERSVLLDPSYATSAFRIRFRLTTDHVVSEGGFFVDDLRISSASFSSAAPLEDFEDGDGGYTVAGANASWEHGAPVSAPGAAFSGESAWATNLNGFYRANEDSSLTSPPLDLGAAAGQLLAVAWRQFLVTEEGFDFLHLEFSADGGETWEAFSTSSGEVNPGGWTRRHAFLPPSYATSEFRLRFRLASDESFQFDGAAIDDVAVLSTWDLFPEAGSFTRSAPVDFPVQLARAHFEAVYRDPDGGAFAGIVIEELPAAGSLKLGSEAAAAGVFIPAAELDELVYEPEAGFHGEAAFTYRASNAYGSSLPGTVTLASLLPGPQIVIVEEPEPLVVNPGEPASFAVLAISSLGLAYQWFKDGQEIPGATGPVFEIDAAEEEDEGDYEVVVHHLEDAATSRSASLSVNDPVVIVGQSGPSAVNEGSDIVLFVQATGTGRLDYQWYKDGGALTGETTAGLEIRDAGESDTAVYHCVVENVVGSVPSEPIPLEVMLAPRIVSHPLALGVQKLGAATFGVVAEGAGPFTYQWFHDGIAIPGATGATLNLDQSENRHAGDYTVRVSNGWASAESEPARLQVFVWADVRGVYQDVLEREGPVDGESPFLGRLTVALSGAGSVSGTVSYGRRATQFRGRLDDQLSLERHITRGRLLPVGLRLELDAESRSIRAIAWHEEEGVVVEGSANLPLHVYHASTKPAPQGGRYTLLLRPDEGEGVPESFGFLQGEVTQGGIATLAGRLPDGKAFTVSGRMHDTGRLPLHHILHETATPPLQRVLKLSPGPFAGDLCGRFVFEQESDGESFVPGGGLVWSNASRPAMPDAFVTALGAEGSPYVAPGPSEPLLTLPLGSAEYLLEIEGAFTGGTLERWVGLAPPGSFHIDPVTDARVRIEPDFRTGLVRGTFVDVDTGTEFILLGVVLQNRQAMAGFVRDVEWALPPGFFVMEPLFQ